MQIDKLILKLMWKCNVTEHSKHVLKKRKSEESYGLTSKTYSKRTAIKTVWDWHKERQKNEAMESNKEPKNTLKRSCSFSYDFPKAPKQYNGERIQSDPDFTPFAKIIDLNVKAKTIRTSKK